MAKEKIETKQINKDLDEHIIDKINIEVEKIVRREEKKLMRYKNRKIIKRDIIIIILIFFYLLLGYNLYNTNYFDRFLNKYFNHSYNEVENNVVESSDDIDTEDTTKTVDLTKYESLIDNYKFYQNSRYLNDYFDEELSDEVKMELVFNYLSKDDFEKSGKYLTIDALKLQKEGKKLFTNFNPVSFNYFGNKVYYIEESNSFLLNENKKEEIIPISKTFLDISLDDGDLEIEALVYYVKNGKIYNVITSKEVGSSKDENIKKYEKLLTKVRFVFEKSSDEKYVLKEIEKELS